MLQAQAHKRSQGSRKRLPQQKLTEIPLMPEINKHSQRSQVHHQGKATNSKWLQQHPHYDRSDPYHLLSRSEQATVFRLHTGHICLSHHCNTRRSLSLSRMPTMYATRRFLWLQYGLSKIKIAQFVFRPDTRNFSKVTSRPVCCHSKLVHLFGIIYINAQ